MEMIVIVPVFYRSLLGQTKGRLTFQLPFIKEVRKVIAGVDPREDERTAGIAARLGVELKAPKVTTPSPTVLAMCPDHTVGKCVGLVAE